MTVSREEVTWGYRMILGRDPESEEAFAAHLDSPDLLALRQRLLGSDEFRAGTLHQVRVGRYVDVDAQNVQVECSDDELDRMLDGIAREWKAFGKRDPHWSVLVDDKYTSQNFERHAEEFYETGRPDIRRILSMVRRSHPALAIDRALDFGCGTGRLTLALAEQVGQVVGVDISPPHLAQARQRAAATGRTNVDFEPIRSVDDLGRYRELDLVISLIVLQHNPPPVMASILRRLLGALRVGGVAAFQLPTFFEGRDFTVADYLAHQQPSMEMNALPQKDVFRIIEEAGCLPLEVREDGHIGDMNGLSHTFLVERIR